MNHIFMFVNSGGIQLGISAVSNCSLMPLNETPANQPTIPNSMLVLVFW